MSNDERAIVIKQALLEADCTYEEHAILEIALNEAEARGWDRAIAAGAAQRDKLIEMVIAEGLERVSARRDDAPEGK